MDTANISNHQYLLYDRKLEKLRSFDFTVKIRLLSSVVFIQCMICI